MPITPQLPLYSIRCDLETAPQSYQEMVDRKLSRRRHSKVVLVVWLLYVAVIECAQASPATTQRARGVSSIRHLNQEAEIKVRAEDKNDDKEDKDDDKQKNDTDSPTVSPTKAPIGMLTNLPTIGTPTLSQSIVASASSTIIPSDVSPLIPSVIATVAPSSAETLVPSMITSSNITETLMPSVFHTGTATILENTTSNNTLFPLPPSGQLATSKETFKSPVGATLGIALAVGAIVVCMGSFSFVAAKRRRRKHQETPLGGDMMSEEAMARMKWSDVFHHSLTNERKCEIAPACTTTSLFQTTIIEEREEVEDEPESVEDVALGSLQQQEEDVILREVEEKDVATELHQNDCRSTEIAEDSDSDAYSRAVAAMLACGILESDSDEKKCSEDVEIGSVTSEDLEYMYGTLPSNKLPSTPRTSNVSPEGKIEGTQRRALLPSFQASEVYATRHLLGQEEDEEGEECDLYWV